MQAQVIERMEWEDYERLPDIHCTELKHLLTSPLTFKRRREIRREPTDQMIEGQAGHTAILEPDEFIRRYVLWEGGVRRGKTWDAFEAQASSARKTVLTEAQYSKALRMRDAARNHPIAGRILSEKASVELSLRWEARPGLTVKCRLDWIGSALVDLKSSRDVAHYRFAAQAAQLGYPMQLDTYRAAAMSAGLMNTGTPVKIIAVQNGEPFDVVVYSIDAETLNVGRIDRERALDIYTACERDQYWPGIAEDTEIPLMLPKWAHPLNDEPAAVNDDDLAF